MRKQSPCKDCDIRKLGCHDSCVPYKDFTNTRSIIRVTKSKFYEDVAEQVASVERCNKK